MHISQRQFGSARILDLHGPLVGLRAAECLDQAIASLVRESSLLIVNLGQVTELDDEVLCVLGAAGRDLRRAGGVLRVAVADGKPQGRQRRQLRVFFDCFDSVEDALADVRASMSGPVHRRALSGARVMCHSWWRRISR